MKRLIQFVSRDVHIYSTLLLGVVVALALQACAVNPMARAETMEQRVYAAYGSFVILQESAASLVQDEAVPENMQRRIIQANRAAAPVADSMLDAFDEYVAIRDEFAATGSGEEKLLLAIENVDRWIDDLIPVVDNLRSALRR